MTYVLEVLFGKSSVGALIYFKLTFWVFLDKVKGKKIVIYEGVVVVGFYKGLELYVVFGYAVIVQLLAGFADLVISLILVVVDGGVHHEVVRLGIVLRLDFLKILFYFTFSNK